MTTETDPGVDLVNEIMRRRVAVNEGISAGLMGAEHCPSGTHGDFVNGEVVPGDLPCGDCGAAV